MQIIPSILEKNSTDVFSQLKRLISYFNTFQVDIADGRFVPNRTMQIEEFSSTIQQLSNETMGPLSFDLHLMVKDYEKEIEKLDKLRSLINVKNIFIHYSLFPNIYYLTSNFPSLTLGLVLNPDDSVEDLTKRYTLNPIPSIQIMSVNPGFQGSPFIPETLKKIEQLRLKDYRNKIYLDGAINQDTIPLINSLKYKPDYLCIGSFLTKAENLEERVNYLKEKVK